MELVNVNNKKPEIEDEYLIMTNYSKFHLVLWEKDIW